MTAPVPAASVRALLLDVDDTLIDTRTAMLAACRSVAAELWPGLPPSRYDSFARQFYDDPGGYFDRYAAGALAFADMRAARLVEAARAAGLPERDSGRFESAYTPALAASQRLFDDVGPLLDRSGQAGVDVCLVTNSSTELTARKLAAVGLGPFPLVTTDTFGVGKPDPRLFAHACALLEVPAEAALVVGDTLDTDIRGALRAGCPAAWLQRPGIPAPRGSGWGTPVDDPAVTVVGSLIDVAAML